MNTEKIMNEKKVWRERMRAELKKVETQNMQGCKATAHVLEWDVFKQAEVIAAYYAMADEIDTSCLLKAVLDQKKTLCLPKTFGKGKMRFFKVTDLKLLQKGFMDIMEPLGDEEEILPCEIDLCFVPAVAMSSRGERLGHGGGYYDRFLPLLKGNSAAFVLKEQIAEGIPCENNDFLIKYIIDSDGIIKA